MSFIEISKTIPRDFVRSFVDNSDTGYARPVFDVVVARFSCSHGRVTSATQTRDDRCESQENYLYHQLVRLRRCLYEPFQPDLVSVW